MTDEDLRKVLGKLQQSGVTLIALYYGDFPADEAACRTIFENSKKLGVKYFVSEPDPDRLPMLDKLAQEYGMIVGLHGHDKASSPNTWHPELVAQALSVLFAGYRSIQRYRPLDPLRTRSRRRGRGVEGPGRRLRNP